jgi:dihydropteroate synthase
MGSDGYRDAAASSGGIPVTVGEPGLLRLGRREFAAGQPLVMGIVNRTPDSFYRPAVTWDESAAMDRVDRVIAEGADIVDVGGVPAGAGPDVDAVEEIRRTAAFIAAVRDRYPDVVISVDTWRHEVARAACEAGADLINDSWGGRDEQLPTTAAELGAGLVCAHAGGQQPRTGPFRVAYADVMGDVLEHVLRLAGRAVAAGVDPASVVIDAAHDFGKNTWHSLAVTRRLGEMTATGWPVLVSVSNKDFIGETLDLPATERLAGTLAATAVCAWHGARIFRAHEVIQTRHAVDMVAAIRGDTPPARAIRGLALPAARPRLHDPLSRGHFSAHTPEMCPRLRLSEASASLMAHIWGVGHGQPGPKAGAESDSGGPSRCNSGLRCRTRCLRGLAGRSSSGHLPAADAG